MAYRNKSTISPLVILQNKSSKNPLLQNAWRWWINLMILLISLLNSQEDKSQKLVMKSKTETSK